MTYIIAEIGNNHNGSIKKAKLLVKEAANAGADAIKTQSFRGLDIVSPNVLMSEFPDWDDGKFKYWYEFADDLALPLENHQELIDYSHSLDLDFITTPVSIEILEYLEELQGIDSYKVASMDLNNKHLLQGMANTHKPIVMSTGMGSLKEVDDAVNIFKHSELTVLHCVSDYPLDPKNAALNNILELRKLYSELRIGFSDHSLGHELALLAITHGAQVIEKHFTLDRKDKSRAEHHMSMEPKEFKEMVDWVRNIEEISSKKGWTRSKGEPENKKHMRRSFSYKNFVQAGTKITIEDLVFLRPGDGIGFEELDLILDKKIIKDQEAFTACLLDHFK